MKRKQIKKVFYPYGTDNQYSDAALSFEVEKVNGRLWKKMGSDQYREAITFLEECKHELQTCIDELKNSIPF